MWEVRKLPRVTTPPKANFPETRFFASPALLGEAFGRGFVQLSTLICILLAISWLLLLVLLREHLLLDIRNQNGCSI